MAGLATSEAVSAPPTATASPTRNAPPTTDASAATGARCQAYYGYLYVWVAFGKVQDLSLVRTPVATGQPTADLVREGDRAQGRIQLPDRIEAAAEPLLSGWSVVRSWRRLHAIVLARSSHFPLGKHVDNNRPPTTSTKD